MISQDSILADKVVAHGVGHWLMEPGFLLIIDGETLPLKDFLEDWRVAGGLLTEAEGTLPASDFYDALLPAFTEASWNPRSIIEKCLEALDRD